MFSDYLSVSYDYVNIAGNDEIKEINIKNRTCYYFDHIIKIEDFDFIIFY